jgi:nucleotide-binding universal stress UspA family protein
MKPRIFVPFDFSSTAEQALAWAADLQRTTSGEPLQMVHAISSSPRVSVGDASFDMLLPNDDEVAGLERAMVEAARARGAAAAAKVVIRASAIGDIVVDAAREASAELIVMGTHGRTGVRRLVLGSVAEHVLRHADCPVVTVRGTSSAASSAA